MGSLPLPFFEKSFRDRALAIDRIESDLLTARGSVQIVKRSMVISGWNIVLEQADESHPPDADMNEAALRRALRGGDDLW